MFRAVLVRQHCGRTGDSFDCCPLPLGGAMTLRGPGRVRRSLRQLRYPPVSRRPRFLAFALASPRDRTPSLRNTALT